MIKVVTLCGFFISLGFGSGGLRLLQYILSLFKKARYSSSVVFFGYGGYVLTGLDPSQQEQVLVLE